MTKIMKEPSDNMQFDLELLLEAATVIDNEIDSLELTLLILLINSAINRGYCISDAFCGSLVLVVPFIIASDHF